MPPHDAAPQIRCPIALFEVCEARIRAFTDGINQSQGAEKARFAQALLEETGRLLACESYDEGAMDCRLCRNFSELRQKTASLVLQMTAAGGGKGEGGGDS